MPRNPEQKYSFVNVELDNITNGKEFYIVQKPNKRMHRGVYKIGDNFWYDNDRYKQYITVETQALFENARIEFLEQIQRAAQEQDDYRVIKVADYSLAYKKLPQNLLYSFVLAGKNYTNIFTTNIYDFLDHLILPTISREQERLDLLEMKSSLLSAAQRDNDLYLAFAIKESMGRLTQEEADHLYSIDKMIRFVPEDKIYDIRDIEIVSVKNGFYSFSNRVVNFYCNIIIKGKEFVAQWYPVNKKYERSGYCFTRANGDPNFLTVNAHSCHTIKISDSVIKIIENKIEKL